MCAFRNAGIAVCQARGQHLFCRTRKWESYAYPLTESGWWREWLSAWILWTRTLRGWRLVTGVCMRGMRMPNMWMAGNALKNREESIASIACPCWQIVGVIMLYSPEMHSNINGEGEGQSLDPPKVDLLAKYKIRGGAWECWSYLVTWLCQSSEWKK